MNGRVNRTLVAALVLTIIAVLNISAVYAAEPRYVDIALAGCDLDISNSIAECTGWVDGRSLNNEFRITMVLYQDDNDYATWENCDIGRARLNETCYVTRDHEYYVGIYIAVYDPNGNFIEDAIAYTGTYYY